MSTHPEWRLAPPWLPGVAYPLIIAVGLGLAGALWLQRRRRSPTGTVGERDALLALALVMLLRCLLDNWDVIYYLLPFVLALLAWEVRGPSRRPPVLALTSSVLAWISFQWLPLHASPDVQAAFFLAWSVPLAGALGVLLYGPNRLESGGRSRVGWSARGQELTVGALDGLVGSSWSSAVPSVRPPLRAPRWPGR